MPQQSWLKPNPSNKTALLLGVAVASFAMIVGLVPFVPAGALPAQAQEDPPDDPPSSINPAPTFPGTDDGYARIGDRPGPVAFLGVGDGGLHYVAESTQGTAANAHGYNWEAWDNQNVSRDLATDEYASTTPYSESFDLGLGTEVLDQATFRDFRHDPHLTWTVTITREDPSEPWVAHIVGNQHEGFRGLSDSGIVRTVEFGDVDSHNATVPGNPVGVVAFDGVSGNADHDSQAPRIVFATDQGVFTRVLFGGGSTLLRSAEAEAIVTDPNQDVLDDPPIAIAADTELPGTGFTSDAYNSPEVAAHRFSVATADQLDDADGDRSRLSDIRLVELGVTGASSSDFNAFSSFADSVEDDIVTWPTDGPPLQLRMSYVPGVPNTRSRVALGVQADGVFQRFAYHVGGSQTVISRERFDSCGDSGADESPGFDFVQHKIVENRAFGQNFTGEEYAQMWAALCVTSTSDGELLLEGIVEPFTGTTVYEFSRSQHARTIPAPETGNFTDPQVHFTAPCAELLRMLDIDDINDEETTVDNGCARDYAETSGGTLYYHADPIFRMFNASILAGIDEDPDTDRFQSEDVAFISASPFADIPGQGRQQGTWAHPGQWTDWDQSWTKVLSSDDSGDPGTEGLPRYLTRLPNDDIVMDVDFDEDDDCVVTAANDGSDCDPALEWIDPVPVAVLAAPPYVAGANQEPGGPPSYSLNSTVGGGEESVDAARVGASVGYEWSSPLDIVSVEASVEYERETSTSMETSYDLSQGQTFGGLGEEDAMVYNANSVWSLPGTVTYSSTGIGLGGQTVVEHPRSTNLSSSSVEHVRNTWPELFGEEGTLTAGLDNILSHEPGDPGSYLEYYHDDGEVAAVNDACIGSHDGSEPVEAPRISHNPFLSEGSPAPPDLAVLISDEFHVQAGTANSEGATISMADNETVSYLETHSIDASLKGSVFGVGAGISGGGTWGSGWSYSIGEETAFEGHVGHIPYPDLQDETYLWRMFLCKQDMVADDAFAVRPSLPVWVLNYTVDSYHGTGGLHLSDIEAVAPIQSAIVEGDGDLEWRLETGTIERFDWELEAVGVPDRREGTIEFADIGAFRQEFFEEQADGTFDPVPIELSAQLEDLIPGQTYRWRVQATDFFGNQTATDYEYFATQAEDEIPPPDATFTWEPATPTVGDEVTFTSNETAEDGTTFSWSGFDEPSAEQIVTTVFDTPGMHEVTLDVEHAGGTASETQAVAVRARVYDVDYNAVQDEQLQVDTSDGVASSSPDIDRVELANEPLYGTVRLATGGAFTYIPDSGFCGTDAFSFRGYGGGMVGSRLGTATIDVECVEPEPDINVTYQATQDEPLEVPASEGVIADVADLDRVELVHEPQYGTAALRVDGGFVYTPDPGSCGTDSFTFRGYDDPDRFGTVTVEVQCVPSVLDHQFAGQEGSTLTVNAPGLLAGTDQFYDESDQLIAEIVDVPTRGEVALNDDGAFTYQPAEGFCGDDGFSYRAVHPGDDPITSDPGEVLLSIECEPEPDIEVHYHTLQHEPLEVAAEDGVLSDVEDLERVELVNQPRFGSVRVAADGGFSYTPDDSVCGDDVFTFRGYGDDDYERLGTATIEVRCVPEIAPREFDGEQDHDLEVDAPGLIEGIEDTDYPYPDELVPELVDEPDHGTIIVEDDGSFVYTPDAGYCGTDTFTYRLVDAATYDEPVASAPVEVALTIECEPEPDPCQPVTRFSDVTVGQTHADTIHQVASLCIVAGYRDGRFGPADPVTRGQLATMLANALDLQPTSSRYPDVPPNHTHARGIASLGYIATGFDDGTFRPDDPVTRGQIATLLRNALDIPNGRASYTDVGPGNVHAEAISAVGDTGIRGFEDGTFRPHDNVTRAQTATFITRTILE